VYDREGRLSYVNRAGLEWFDTNLDEVVARRPAELDSERHNTATWDALTQALDHAFTSGKTVTFEALGVVSPREPARDFEAVVNPIPGADGRIVSAVVVARDITARKQGEAQRLKLAIERERMQLMSHFVEAVSHDFRTSLTIIEANRFLLATQLDAEQRQALSQRLSRIQESVLRLEMQIDNLSALASLSAMRETPFDLNGVVQAAVSEMEVHSRQKGHTLTGALTDARLMILGDAQHMRRALSELLRNAINFTPPGGVIAVRVVLADDAAGAPEARVEIVDNGIGITADQLPLIFDLFYRADPARAIESGGIGLGLSIAEIIVNAHNGRITVSSIPGGGSTFTVHLPIPTAVG
jgi:signal transduction histidine kinase